MRTLLTLTLFSLCSALAACHQPENKPTVNLLEAQQKQLQKARDVETTLQKAADAQRKAIDEQSGVAPEK